MVYRQRLHRTQTFKAHIHSLFPFSFSQLVSLHASFYFFISLSSFSPLMLAFERFVYSGKDSGCACCGWSMATFHSIIHLASLVYATTATVLHRPYADCCSDLDEYWEVRAAILMRDGISESSRVRKRSPKEIARDSSRSGYQVWRLKVLIFPMRLARALWPSSTTWV